MHLLERYKAGIFRRLTQSSNVRVDTWHCFAKSFLVSNKFCITPARYGESANPSVTRKGVFLDPFARGKFLSVVGKRQSFGSVEARAVEGLTNHFLSVDALFGVEIGGEDFNDSSLGQ